MQESVNGSAQEAERPAPSARPSDWETLRRLAPYLWMQGDRRNQRRVIAALLCLLMAKLVLIGAPFLFKHAVDSLSALGSLQANGGNGLWAAASLGFALAYAFARFASVAFAQIRDALFARTGHRALRRLALETFRHIHRLPLSFHLTRRTGALSRIVDRGVKAIEFLMRFLLLNLVPLVLELLLVSAVFLIRFDQWFFFAITGTIALYVFFTVRVTSMRVRIRHQMNEADAEAGQRALDSLINYETVKYFTAEAREAMRFDTSMARYERMAVRTQITLALLNGGQAAISAIGLMLVLALAVSGVMEGRLTVGDFVLINSFMMQVMMPLGFLGTMYREIRLALTDMAEMMALLDQRTEGEDAPSCRAAETHRATLAFDRVRFGYDGKRPILHELSFSLAEGRMLAVVGASGSGKSTIARLIYRFYEPQGGRILFSGRDIRQWPREALRAQIGIVPQDIPLFNDTIGYNIAYGNSEADRDAVVAAARAAHIHSFIETLPEGYETLVGERGLRLSGGERQRIAIARAMLKNPPLLILDEATSALDTRTERDIRESLAMLAANRTVITIAHRLSTVVEADEIIVLVAGRVAERGTHRVLLAREALYAAMWREQEARRAAEAATEISP